MPSRSTSRRRRSRSRSKSRSKSRRRGRDSHKRSRSRNKSASRSRSKGSPQRQPQSYREKRKNEGSDEERAPPRPSSSSALPGPLPGPPPGPPPELAPEGGKGSGKASEGRSTWTPRHRRGGENRESDGDDGKDPGPPPGVPRFRGFVKKWNRDKKFGFIRADEEGGQDYFFHMTGFREPEQLLQERDLRVTFIKTFDRAKKNDKADDVRKDTEAPAPASVLPDPRPSFGSGAAPVDIPPARPLFGSGAAPVDPARPSFASDSTPMDKEIARVATSKARGAPPAIGAPSSGAIGAPSSSAVGAPSNRTHDSSRLPAAFPQRSGVNFAAQLSQISTGGGSLKAPEDPQPQPGLASAQPALPPPVPHVAVQDPLPPQDPMLHLQQNLALPQQLALAAPQQLALQTAPQQQQLMQQTVDMNGVVAYGANQSAPPPEITGYTMQGFKYNPDLNATYWKEERDVLGVPTFWTLDKQYFFYQNAMDNLWRICPVREADGTDMFRVAAEGGNLGIAELQKQEEVGPLLFKALFMEYNSGSDTHTQWPMVLISIRGEIVPKPYDGPSIAQKALDAKRPSAAPDKPWASEADGFTEAQYQPSASSSAKPSGDYDERWREQGSKGQQGGWYAQKNRQWENKHYSRESNGSWQGRQGEKPEVHQQDWAEETLEVPRQLEKHFREGNEHLDLLKEKSQAHEITVLGDGDGATVKLKVGGSGYQRNYVKDMIQQMTERVNAEAKPSQATAHQEEEPAVSRSDDARPTASPSQPQPTSSRPSVGVDEADVETAAEDLAAQAPATDVPPDDIPAPDPGKPSSPSGAEGKQSPSKLKADGLTTGELRELLKERGVKNVGKMNKQKLQEALQELEA